MKILVFAHKLEVGGTQVNAIELSAALRDLHGHEVVLFAEPGPMVSLANEKGLRFSPAPDARIHPSPARMSALRKVVKREQPDVIHVWDWPQCLDAYYAIFLLMRIPMVVTEMGSVGLNRLLPKALHTTFGTPEFVDRARAAGRRRVELLLPPVDVTFNAPGAVDSRPFRQKYGVKEGDITLVTVSRLVEWMKAESLLRTIDVVRELGREMPLRFLVVGDGDSRGQLEQRANEANTELGREAIAFTGALLDPRPAYDAADIVVGMGGSALRGMAFAKPVIVVGQGGFSESFTPDTEEYFYYNGIYGVADGSLGNRRLIECIRGLAAHPDELPSIGKFSREFVERHFSLEVLSAQVEKLCRRAISEKPQLGIAVADGVRTAFIYWAGRFIPGRFKRRVKPVTAS